MQWLYNLIHGLFSIMFSWFGKIWWLTKNSISFQIAIVTSLIGVGVILWRMFYFGITSLITQISNVPLVLESVSGVSSFGGMLDVANYIFPVEEVFAMMSILISYGVLCLNIRIVRAFIPTMT